MSVLLADMQLTDGLHEIFLDWPLRRNILICLYYEVSSGFGRFFP